MQQKWMQDALREAKKAFAEGEVPVGAVVVYKDQVIGRGFNRVEALQSPIAHAEMQAIGAAANFLGTWRLNDAAIYVTLEPCPMCMGALHLARLSHLVYGASDPRLGACGSVVDLTRLQAMRPPLEVTRGVLADESRQLLQGFFQKLREKNSNKLGQ